MRKKLERLLTPPAWFKPQNAAQEDTVRNMWAEHEELDTQQQNAIAEAKGSAMGKMAETVRDWDSRPDCMVTGEIRPWTQEAYERVRRNKLRKENPIKYWFLYFLPIFRYEHP